MKLELYYFPSCPFCQKVLKAMEGIDTKITLKNTKANDAYRQELIKLTGKTQVPCLSIDGKPKHESDDIVKWLKANA
jgi:glutaredoxin